MDQTITYKELTLSDLQPEFLSDFVRFQETHKVLYKTDDGYSIKDDHFFDYWDDEKKKQVIEDLMSSLQDGGTVFGAYIGKELLGFSNIAGRLFGFESQYVELPYIHVSANHRGHGIGRTLFRLCMEAAQRKGADKLYIAAHPSIETQEFYKQMGCTYALEVNEEIFKKEPLDIQMERRL